MANAEKIYLDIPAAVSIERALDQARARAQETGKIVWFDFKTHRIEVGADSSKRLLRRNYFLANDGEQIGPHAERKLNLEQKSRFRYLRKRHGIRSPV